MIKEITFEEIERIWATELWPNRTSEIKGMSSMRFLGGYNMSVYEKYEGTFWGAYMDNVLVGVNSGHQCSSSMYRSRGLWVNPAYRGNGIAKDLLNVLITRATKCRCDYVFTVPRYGSEHAYTSSGFLLVGKWFDQGMEFGPNIWAIKALNTGA